MRSRGEKKGFATREKAAMVLLFLLFVCCATLPLLALAHPPLPVVFYGDVYQRNGPAGAGITIEAKYNGISCGAVATTADGHFGVLACPGDDPETVFVDGATNEIGRASCRERV